MKKLFTKILWIVLLSISCIGFVGCPTPHPNLNPITHIHIVEFHDSTDADYIIAEVMLYRERNDSTIKYTFGRHAHSLPEPYIEQPFYPWIKISNNLFTRNPLDCWPIFDCDVPESYMITLNIKWEKLQSRHYSWDTFTYSGYQHGYYKILRWSKDYLRHTNPIKAVYLLDLNELYQRYQLEPCIAPMPFSSQYYDAMSNMFEELQEQGELEEWKKEHKVDLSSKVLIATRLSIYPIEE